MSRAKPTPTAKSTNTLNSRSASRLSSKSKASKKKSPPQPAPPSGTKAFRTFAVRPSANKAAPEDEQYALDIAIERFAKRLLGRRPMVRSIQELQQSMLVLALEQTKGNLTQAGELLDISRQHVQQLLKRYELRDWLSHLRDLHS